MPQNYHIIAPKGKKVPILVSVPHAGTSFPKAIRQHYKKALINPPDDTDFFVHDLYDFASEMGITLIHAPYCRWVIDLNRSPENEALYTDGRIITALCPSSNFLGNPIYKAPKFEPNKGEIIRRKALYFTPYYLKIERILNNFKEKFGFAILWDAHSIRRKVPTIQKAAFPDMILGTNDGQSANTQFIQLAKKGLKSSEFNLANNTPFKGGNITRHFGKPTKDIHALQLEMCKDLYMDDAELNYHPQRAEKMQYLLKHTFQLLIEYCVQYKK